MTAVENAYAMAEWRLKDPDIEDNKQIADKLTSEEREKWWPVMLAHKTWETKDWQATDNEDKKGEIVENEDEEPEGRTKKTIQTISDKETRKRKAAERMGGKEDNRGRTKNKECTRKSTIRKSKTITRTSKTHDIRRHRELDSM